MSHIRQAYASNGTFVAQSSKMNFNSRLAVTYDGSAIVTLDLATTGVTAGTYSAYVVDTYGRVTSGSALTFTGDITGTASGTSVAMTLPASGVTAGTYTNIVVTAKGLVSSATFISYIQSSLLGATSGVATLDATGKLTSGQIPASLVGAVVYQGTWNASTNSPTLTSGTGTKGYYYKVSTAGTTTLDGNSTWNIGDTAIFDGSTWDKIDGISSEVLSVNGQTGVVSITSITGNAATATALATAQPIALSGDVTGTANFAGNTGSTITATLAASGATAGTYSAYVVNAKGLVTSGLALTATGDVTGTASASSIALTLASVGTAGSYTYVTTDAKGRVTAGGNLAVTGDVSGTALGGALTLTLATVATAGTFTGFVVNAKGLVTSGTNLAVTGDVTGTASGTSIALTLASANTSGAGTYTAFVANAKGLVTSGTNLAVTGDVTGTASGTSIALTLATVGTAGTYTAFVANAKGLVTSGTNLAVTGDVTGTASGSSIALTLATVGAVGTYSSVVTDAKGRVLSGAAYVAPARTVVTGSYTVLATDRYLAISVTSATTITITASVSSEGRMLTFKDEGSTCYTNNVTISSSELIDGASTTVMNVNGEAITLYYSGSKWWIV